MNTHVKTAFTIYKTDNPLRLQMHEPYLNIKSLRIPRNHRS